MSTVLQFPLVMGVNEGTDPKQLPPGSLTRLTNLAWTKNNRLDKRAGTTAINKDIVTSAKRLIVRGSELCLTDGTNLYSYRTSQVDGPVWRNAGPVAEVGLTWDPLLDTVDGLVASDLAYEDGILTQVWLKGDPTSFTTAGAVYWQQRDLDNAAIKTAPTKLSTAVTCTAVRVISKSDVALVFQNNGGGIEVSQDGAAWVQLRNDAVTRAPFDVVVVGNTFVIAYALSGGGIKLASFNFNTPPVQQAAVTVAGEASTDIWSISITGASAESLYIGYIKDDGAGGATVRFAAANPSTLAQTQAPTTLDSPASVAAATVSVCRYDATHCVYAYTLQDTVSTTVVSKIVKNDATVTATRKSFDLVMLSRPFMLGSVPYMALGNSLPTSKGAVGGDNFLVAIETTTLAAGTWPHRYVGKIECLIGARWLQLTGGLGFVCTPAALSSTQVVLSTPYLADATVTSTGLRQAAKLVTCSIGASLPADMWRPVELGGETYFAAGVLQAYDGRQPFDYGMAGPAVLLTNYTTATTGGHMVTGNYIYSTVPVFYSYAGVLHRGPTYPGITINPAGTNVSLVNLSIAVPTLSSKRQSVAGAADSDPFHVGIELYRTIVTGSTLQKLSVEPAFNFPLAPYNATPLSFTDTRADSDVGTGQALSARPVIYSIGELDDFQPPSFTTLHLHKNRLFGIAGDQKTVWYSKDYSENPGTAAGFHPNAILVFDETLTGLATLDNKLVFFSAGGIWYLEGDGPSASGNGGFDIPSRIQTDVGCTNPRSIVSTPDGIMFLSSRGIYLLTRALELRWIGFEIKDTLASYPNITSAVLVHQLNQVRFTCNNTGATLGVVLVFDHVRNHWSTFQYYDTDGAVASTPIADACLLGETYTFVTPGGQVFQENTASYLDGGSHWITGDLEIAWIHSDGPVGYQRVRRAYLLGDLNTGCDLLLRIGINHSSGYDQSHTFTAATLASLADGINVGLVCKTQKTRAMRLRVTDATPSSGSVGTGQGFNLSAIGLEVEPKPGLTRRPATAVG